MKIEIAAKPHATEIFKLLQDVALDMRKKGINQWNENYPTLSHVEKDLADEIAYIGRIENKIVGVISIDSNQSPEYSNVNWKYPAGKILVVHRLAVCPQSQKLGIGNQFMNFVLEKAKNEKYTSIRLDAYSENDITLRFYEKRGYIKRGEIYFPYRTAPFYCFEKKID